MKTKLELINHCLVQTKHLTPYTFEHYVMLEMLGRLSDDEFEEICKNYKYTFLNDIEQNL